MLLGVWTLISCSSQTALDEGVSENQNSNLQADSYNQPVERDWFAENPREAAKIYNKRIPPLNSLIVCRDKQCAPAELSMSKEYIYNSLAHLVDNNLDSTALLCEANPQAHVCINPYLTVPAKIGVTPAYVYFDGVKFVDASATKGRTAVNLALGYNLSYNGQTPTVCKPDEAMLYVKSNNDVALNGNGFKCEMTSVGTTTIRIMFAIDYIDLDYGYIGGYYSIGLSGPAHGGGSGYGLIRLIKDAHPLNPVLTTSSTNADDSVSPSAIPVKPSVKELPIPEINDNEGLAPVEVLEKGESSDRQNASAKDSSANAGGSSVEDNVQVFPNHESKAYNRGVDYVPSAPVNVDTGYVPVEKQEEPKFEEIYIDDLDEYIK